MFKRSIGCCLLALHLSGCGTYTPELEEPLQSQAVGLTVLEAVSEHVECEVRSAVQSLVLDDISLDEIRRLKHLKRPDLQKELKNWGAQVTFTLTVDEKSTFNPGISINNPLPTAVSTFSKSSTVMTPQSFTLGLGGSASSDATRRVITALHLNFAEWITPQRLAVAKELRRLGPLKAACGSQGKPFIDGDLKFDQILYASLLPAATQGTQIDQDYIKSIDEEAKLSKKDAISQQVTFIITYSGNITPTWKLVRVSANTGSTPLFSAQRTRTEDMLITIGPMAGDKPNPTTQVIINASLIGLLTGSAIRSNSQ